MSWDLLSSDVICVILGYAWWNSLGLIYANGVVVKTKRQPSNMTDRRIIMRLMRLNKTTYAAGKKLRTLWITILVKHGPKRIGPTSNHVPLYPSLRCRMNREGKCHVAVHYHNLEPVYDITQQFGAYEAVLKWGSKKIERRHVAQIKREKKTLAKYQQAIIPDIEDKISKLEADVEYIKQDRKRRRKK